MTVPNFSQVVQAFKDDYNVRTLRLFFTSHRQDATKRYLLGKVPIVEWITHYSPRWLGNDLLAGLTIGILLVPQSLAYAKVANIDARYGLISSWLPPLFYAIMGTSKDVTAGPTAIMYALYCTALYFLPSCCLEYDCDIPFKAKSEKASYHLFPIGWTRVLR